MPYSTTEILWDLLLAGDPAVGFAAFIFALGILVAIFAIGFAVFGTSRRRSWRPY